MSDRPEAAPFDPHRDLAWYDAAEIGVEGKGWAGTERYYDRLPARARDLVHEKIWGHGRKPAGMVVHFQTDATDLWARWELEDEPGPGPCTTALAHGGLDVYARTDDRRWLWAGFGAPTGKQSVAWLAGPFSAERRTYRVYLPAHAALESLEFGVRNEERFTGIPPRPDKPIVYYGTSIVHGSNASRTGMTHPAILSRRIDLPFINLGFGGAGWMDPEVGDLLAELEAACYVIDCLPNMDAHLVADRTEPLVEKLREARPDAPIVLVEDRTLARARFSPTHRQAHEDRRDALRFAWERLRDAGMQRLHYLEGEHLLGEDNDGTVDSSHPNDLGFHRMACALEPVLREALG